jgi:MinD-like ATPase involved in chromosome partitioning or flagellar assembly
MASAAQAIPEPASRVIFTEGGKGGVGKTAFTTGLVEWFDAQQIPYTLLDLDTENKARGSLTHYFRDKTRKVNIQTPEGLDSFIDALDGGPPIVIADMGAGSGQVAHRWFESMYDSVRAIGVVFTAIGIITPDPASVESVLSWAHALQHRVEYLIVKNALTEPADFSYWERSTAAEQFRQAFQPQEIGMQYRLAKFENPARQYGVTLGQAAQRKVDIPELQQTTVVLRAQAYRRHLFAELDRVKGLLLL